MIRTLCAEVLRAIMLVVPGNRLGAQQLLGSVKAGSPRRVSGRQTQFESGKTTYCLGSGRGLRSSLFVNVGE